LGIDLEDAEQGDQVAARRERIDGTTFLIFLWNSSVVCALFVANHVLMITSTLAMIVYF
jgi:hypothetical protein